MRPSNNLSFAVGLAAIAALAADASSLSGGSQKKGKPNVVSV
jgi:hypothetical protein